MYLYESILHAMIMYGDNVETHSGVTGVFWESIKSADELEVDI